MTDRVRLLIALLSEDDPATHEVSALDVMHMLDMLDVLGEQPRFSPSRGPALVSA